MRGKRLSIGATVVLAILTVPLLGARAWAAPEKVLYSFGGGDGGAYPSGLVADAKGNLYGTTQSGGFGYGTAFELELSGGTYTEKMLYSFTGGATDGACPCSALVFDNAGNLYGTAYQGGAYNYGTVFELSFSGGEWKESLLHSFAGTAGKDGQNPQSGLTFDGPDKFYGTTEYGGYGYGIIFQMKRSKGKWMYKVIYRFSGGNSGYYPVGGITPGANGYFYGTTYYGGTTYNAGTVYRVFETKGVWVEQTIFLFNGGAGGAYPNSTLAMDATGNLYGTTYEGGTNNDGTVFKLTLGKNKKYTQSVLYSFKGGNTDGAFPYAGVSLDSIGDIFGTTRYGGSQFNEGTVWELKLLKTGKYKEIILHAFGDTNGDDGYAPVAGVILFKGNLYGTTFAGGTHGSGTVFEIVL